MNDLYSGIFTFTRQKILTESLSDVHMHCAAIISATTPTGWGYPDGVVSFRSKVRQSIRNQLKQQKIYNAFLSLITCYYIKDYPGIYIIRKYLNNNQLHENMPCTLSAANLVLQKTFNRPTGELVGQLLSFYNNNGGFRATNTTKVPDLLSTSVALYALYFAGADLRMIKPDCLDFINSLYPEGGFCGNIMDRDPDIEYTFYGLLALGALAE
jgi:hypothetical protein